MEEISDDFKENVIKYIRYDDLITEKNNEIIELKKKKKLFEEYILKFLIEKNENIINVGDDRIRRIDVKPKTKTPIKINLIKEVADIVLDDNKINNKDKIVEEIIETIEKNRSKIHYNLRRIKPKSK